VTTTKVTTGGTSPATPGQSLLHSLADMVRLTSTAGATLT
jgi:hypothetical protein